MKEEWRESAIPGVWVSNLGRYHVRPGDPRSKPTRGYVCPDSGRMRGSIQINGRTVNFRVHRLVADAFLGPRPPGAVIIHTNEDRTDNRAINLEYGTQRANLNAPKFKAYCASRTGENSPWAKHRRR